jgi:hypothetical protein
MPFDILLHFKINKAIIVQKNKTVKYHLPWAPKGFPWARRNVNERLRR